MIDPSKSHQGCPRCGGCGVIAVGLVACQYYGTGRAAPDDGCAATDGRVETRRTTKWQRIGRLQRLREG